MSHAINDQAGVFETGIAPIARPAVLASGHPPLAITDFNLSVYRGPYRVSGTM